MPPAHPTPGNLATYQELDSEQPLRYDPTKLRTTREALSVAIAHNKAVQAVRDNTKHRGNADDPDDEIDVVSLDIVEDDGRSFADTMAESVADPETEARALIQERIYRRIADKILSDRDRDIYYRIHYGGLTRRSVADELDSITPQRVGQIYKQSAREILAEAQRDPEYMALSEHEEGVTQ